MMTEIDPFEPLRRQQAIKEELTHRSEAFLQRWDSLIRAELLRLAEILWPDGHLLGVIPVRQHRVRHKAGGGSYLWWVEHDIPPYDRYRCAAYRVELSLIDQDRPALSVESGAGVYQVTSLSREAFEAALARAGQDPPLVILREMGEALDS
jgi:hypothetical protein